MTLRTQADVNASEALRPILSAGRPSKFRVLRVVCPNQHRLLDIYRTGKGLAYVGEAGSTWGGEGGRFTPRDRGTVGMLEFPEGRVVDVVCRCRSAEIPLYRLAEMAARPSARVVWPDGPSGVVT